MPRKIASLCRSAFSGRLNRRIARIFRTMSAELVAVLRIRSKSRSNLEITRPISFAAADT